MSILLLQEMFDLIDQETTRQLAFNIEWHFALNLVNEEDDFKYIGERTLRTYHALVMEHEIDWLMFQRLTDELMKKLNISPRRQRLYSTHIRSGHGV